MRKILLSYLIMAFTIASSAAWAQERAISGRVTSSQDGSPLPGVNILVKGTTTGTVTDVDGNYRISVPDGSNILVFSFIGLTSQEVDIAGRSTVDVQMEQDVTQLSEVVVTALGITRNRNELAYSAQQVKGEDIVGNRSVNFVNSLSGKVSGVDIKTSNTMGGSTNVVIRGYKSISGNNQALFVIDGIPVSNANTNTSAQRTGGVGTDYGNAAGDINPDNIESINVLKGAAATALYGSRAANGVVMITTKKGRKNSFQLTVNSGVTWGTMDKSTFARYQKEYGASYDQRFGATLPGGLSGNVPSVRFGDDASYGPRFNPQQLVYQWDARDPYSPNYLTARPWVAAKNDPSTFYETSVASNQSVAITAGGERATFKVAYTRSDEKGSLPNSTLDKDLFNFSTSYDLTRKLTVTASANYSKIVGVGRYGTGYNGKNPNQGFRQWWQTNVDIKEQEAAYWRNRQNVTWNWNAAGTGPLYSDNPYFTRYESYSNDSRDHIFGYATINYKVTNWFDILGRVGYDGTNDMQEERTAVTSEGTPSYSRFNRTYSESNYDLLLNFNKKFADISLRGVLGSNMRRNRLSSIRASTNGGLVVPRFYSLTNSAQPINPPTEEYERVGVDGIFANASVGYKDMVFVELSARQDRSTTLPVDDNKYLYYSAAGTFVFSEVVKLPWLNLGKIRANYARVGNDATALSIYDVYDKPTSLGNIPYFSLPNVKNNASLAPEYTNSYEAGVEAEFFDGRVGLDFTWYHASSFDQVLSVNVTGATGYTGKWVNAGEMQNKGIELSLFGIPIQRNDFSWIVNVNFTRNRNEVISLYGEGDNAVTNYPIASLQGGVSLNAAVGHPYGVIRGKDFVYTNGQRTVNAAGYYETSAASNIIIGNPNPDWIGGINNTFKYKGVGLNFLVDMRRGGDIFSLDQWYGEATGLYPNSAGLNANGVPSRVPVAEGGGILLPGVQADGSPNTVYGENLDGYGQTPFGYVADGQSGAPHKWYVYDGSYIKLREVGLTYSIPASIIELLKPFKGIDISLIGRNLWIIHKNMKYSDPEEGLSSGNTNGGYQSGAYPMYRTYGFNVKLTF
ncbi:SusC/RagA family TonB-linked outer membrane protein [Chryseosolibacter indicus]|uniref:SusC/RagA family TonB-linked outer membrane protein n=1 Tax=Chryseosolibacter indicus TaxID=2782351 RepID=A0ABS5VT02_9BACT|nr:SusC/RagA family TonB-linked outer membrane protein [Chryseosolibacter indicus]MBT1703126.1 SusC/RagA family TonB-linked outer membrane protein [Chryseosolibacter indicus]